MADLRISALSTVYVHVPIRDTLADADLSGDTVRMAFPAAGADPASGDWKTAEWYTDSATTPATYSARCLVGPEGAVDLAAGEYDAWAEITDNPEVAVVKAAGRVVVF